jgi:hypothetical protein
MNRTRVLILLAVACFLHGCSLPRRQHAVIDAYKTAVCVPVLAQSEIRPPSVRAWDATVRTGSGTSVVLSGYQGPGAGIVAKEVRTGEIHVVADAGDYVYPADVRTTADFARVYVKADGLAGGISRETWLFEYDLTQFRELNRVRVEPSVLPPECPGGPATPDGQAR